jgi:ABC-2 type transport system ATP-binding protein
VDEATRTVTAAVTGGVDVLGQVIQRLKEGECGIVDIGLRRPTLNDVFLSITGHSAEEVAESPEEGPGEAEAERVREKEAVR